MAASLKEIADRAGVSIKTVSNVVNRNPSVRPETRARVRRAIDELGHRPNMSARQLRSGRSGLIALAVPGISLPYFAELAELIAEQASVRESRSAATVTCAVAASATARGCGEVPLAACCGPTATHCHNVRIRSIAADRRLRCRYGLVGSSWPGASIPPPSPAWRGVAG